MSKKPWKDKSPAEKRATLAGRKGLEVRTRKAYERAFNSRTAPTVRRANNAGPNS